MSKRVLGVLCACLMINPLFAEAIEQTLPAIIPLKVLLGNPEKAAPQISPDGKRLAYLAPVNGVLNVWVKTVGAQDDRAVSKDTERGVRMYAWAHDNKHLLYIQDTGGDENWHIFKIDVKTEQTVDLTPFDGVQARVCALDKKYPHEFLVELNKENKQLFDVYHVNIETGVLTLREKNPGNVVDWMADNKLKIRAAKTYNDDGGSSLLLRATDKDAWKTVQTWAIEDATKVAIYGFSKDGKKLYLRDPFESNTACLVAYDCATGEKKILLQDPIFDVNGPVGDSEGNLLGACIEKERMHWFSLDPNFEPLLQAMQSIDIDGDLHVANISDDDRYWVLAFVHDNRSTNCYLFDKKNKTVEFLFCPRPELAKYKLASMEPISFIARDGLKIHGYLSCPVGVPREKLPLIVCVHGGPFWVRDSWGVDAEAQWFTNRGYACLQVNYRGSDGYGKNFMAAGYKEYAGKMQDDLIDGVAWAVKQGIADPHKLAIFGGSYGGYAALVGATFTPDLFCCAVDICGMSSLITTLESIPPYWEVFRKSMMKMMGDPDKEINLLKERSPLFKVDNIKIPILIGQGANDVRVKQEEAEQIVAAMKDKGLAYEYVLFPDEGHGFANPKTA